MIRIKTILNIFSLTALLVMISGCKKFVDVNQNLNSPTAVPVSTLLTSAERSIGATFAIGSTVGNGLGVYTHQMMQYGSYNRYGIDGSAMNRVG